MSYTTQTKATETDALKAKNEVVATTYQNIINAIKMALPSYPTEYFRTFVEIDYSSLNINCKHAFFNALIHLQLEEVEGALMILFSRNIVIKQQVGNQLDGVLSRIIYNETAAAKTPISIEDCVSAEVYRVDDFKQASSLLAKGFKGASKVTV